MEFKMVITNLDEVEDFYGTTERFDAEGKDRYSEFTNEIDLPVNPNEIGRIVYETCGGSSRNGYAVRRIDSKLEHLDFDFENIYECNLLAKKTDELLSDTLGEDIADRIFDFINAFMDCDDSLEDILDCVDDFEVIYDCDDEEDFGRYYAEENYNFDYELEEYIEFDRLGDDKLMNLTNYIFYEGDLYIIH